MFAFIILKQQYKEVYVADETLKQYMGLYKCC